jgi:hypothetical protein
MVVVPIRTQGVIIEQCRSSRQHSVRAPIFTPSKNQPPLMERI